MKHLNKKVQPILDLSDKERIEFIQKNKWIGYSKAKNVLNQLEDLLAHPPSHRMPNLLIVGETNNGKSVIAKRFNKLHQAYIKSTEDGVKSPVLYIQAPPIPDEKRFYNIILEETFTPFRVNDRADKKYSQVKRTLEKLEVRMLMIDEIHHILAGNISKQKIFLNVLRYLSNELEISLVCLGTKDAFSAIHSDPQMSNRFEPVVLTKWKLDEDYLRLLASFEAMTPLKNKSNLHQKDLAIKILSMSEGTIGEISNLIKKAAIQAIREKKELIDIDLLNKLNWISPSNRKRQIEKLAI